MQTFKMLVLTDHNNHSKENSLYSLLKTMRQHPKCVQLDVATRVNKDNDAFFTKYSNTALSVVKVNEAFAFYPDGRAFLKEIKRQMVSDYDVVWLRLPPPLSDSFLSFLKNYFPHQIFINDPLGIYETGSKAYLQHFQEYCPPMKLCRSLEDIMAFKNKFPIVLKPLREYGGKGIVRIDGEQVWQGKEQLSFTDFANKIKKTAIEYLGVKFLKNVGQGDKRIIVVNGTIMGASLRLPAKGSWICNVAMGGNSNYAEVDETERAIVAAIHPNLTKMGVVMYGVDTLVGDDGKRVLSEINTTSIGGLPQITELVQQPLLEKAVDLICNYIIEKQTNDVITRE